MTGERKNLVNVDRLTVDVAGRGRGERTPILTDVSLSIGEGEAVGLVGESGSGKSMTTKAIMRLLPKGARTTGSVAFRGVEISGLDRDALSILRSRDLGMVYQDPRAHINPLWTLGDFITEGVVASGQLTRSQARARAIELLADVGIADGERRMRQYPHQLSGGLLQRVMIVAALMPGPTLIIADEPTTALDVTVQSEVMAILDELRTASGAGLLFITHDLDLAAAVTDSIGVMYAGRIIERGPTASVIGAPRHPYTWSLLESRPSTERVERLKTIPGRPISAGEVTAGCAFASRCPFALDICRTERPATRPVDGGEVACHRTEEIRDKLVARDVA